MVNDTTANNAVPSFTFILGRGNVKGLALRDIFVFDVIVCITFWRDIFCRCDLRKELELENFSTQG